MVKLPELKIGRFTAKIPIVQGGMSVGVSMASLASAVAECGGIGTIGGSGIPIDQLKEEIRKAKEMTRGVIAVNIMYAIKQFTEAVKASIEAGVDMIVTGAGFSRDIFKVGREHDVPIVSIVSSPGIREARGTPRSRRRRGGSEGGGRAPRHGPAVARAVPGSAQRW